MIKQFVYVTFCFTFLSAFFIGCGTGHNFTDIMKATSETDTIEEVVDLSNCVQDVKTYEPVDLIVIDLGKNCLIEYGDDKKETETEDSEGDVEIE